ncbi:MAG: SDR family oxidoreductase [Deinococcales bacterium]
MLITGASRGIGAATAHLAAQAGYVLCLNYLNKQQAAKTLMDEITNQGGQAFLFQADISQETQVLAMFEHLDQLSVDLKLPLKVLVNNAGVLEKQMRLEHMPLARWQRIFAINVFGSFLCSREAVKRMSERYGGQGGAIVNVSSAAARLGSANEYVDYAASKGALDTMTLGLAKEVAAEGIRVNSVRPGIIDTEIHASGGEPNRIERVKDSIPLKRAGSAEEVAKSILWLASDEASYITATLLDVAGGR